MELLSSGGRSADDSMAARLATVRWMTPLALVIGLAVASVVGGFAEAVVLYLLVRVATGLAAEQSTFDLGVGPIELDGLSIDTVLLAGVVLVGLRLVCNLVVAILTGRASAAVMLRMRLGLVDAFLRTTWATQVAERQGALQDLTTTHAKAGAKTAVWVSMSIAAGFNFLAMVVSALVIDLAAAAVMAVAVVVLYVTLRPLTRISRSHARRLAEFNTHYASGVNEITSTALEIASFGVSPRVAARHAAEARKASRMMFNVTALTRSLSGLYQGLALSALLLGIWVVADRPAGDLAALGAVIVMLLRALSYGQAFQLTQHNINEQLPWVSRVRNQIAEYERHERTSGDRAMDGFSRITLEGVTFRHGEGAPALQGVSVEISAGEAIGIMGPSGAGKSTLAQILLRLRVPDEGRYLLDGVDAEEFSLQDWYEHVAFVPQEPRIIRGSVRDNVAFFRDLDHVDVERACIQAHLHDEILSWPDGYDTELGSGANPLSGGQRQRLCIARALAGRPQLLLLDEPTSALDMRSESAIQDALEELRGAMTLIIIAHRVPTVRLCDRVLVLDKGHLQTVGPPDELLESNDFFAEAVRLSRL